ncbi:hypothetical protein BJY04DRAFT_216483 [Aspergillus karnatakaensis]|uniref:uncharacterized protein n=1 Tax=Aspergillus karnatakaensis TaxID=1810916 RepID=UPI003CCD9AF2
MPLLNLPIQYQRMHESIPIGSVILPPRSPEAEISKTIFTAISDYTPFPFTSVDFSDPASLPSTMYLGPIPNNAVDITARGARTSTASPEQSSSSTPERQSIRGYLHKGGKIPNDWVPVEPNSPIAAERFSYQDCPLRAVVSRVLERCSHAAPRREPCTQPSKAKRKHEVAECNEDEYFFVPRRGYAEDRAVKRLTREFQSLSFEENDNEHEETDGDSPQSDEVLEPGYESARSSASCELDDDEDWYTKTGEEVAAAEEAEAEDEWSKGVARWTGFDVALTKVKRWTGEFQKQLLDEQQ